jgi:hypothetical protein
MPGWFAAIAVLLLLCLVGVLVFTLFRSQDGERRRARMLAMVTLAALAVLFGITAWLIAPSTPSHGIEAVRSAAFAAGGVLAIYGLWLNDQRRRIEDQRRQVEVERLEKERDQLEYERGRAIEDRFARAVELLGHPKGQTRVGALTMLSGLALDRPVKAREVLDQLCAYLRWPITPAAAADDEHVRRTAQRLLVRLLSEPLDPPAAVDLAGARLVGLTLPAGITLAELRLDGARLDGGTVLAGVKVGTLSLVGSQVFGELDLSRAEVVELTVDDGARFGDRVNLQGAHLGPRLLMHSAVFEGTVSFIDTVVTGTLKCHARFERQVDFTGATFRVEKVTDTRTALLDLSGAVFGDVVTIEPRFLEGMVRLDGAVFESGLVLLPSGAGVWADNVLVAEDGRLEIPPGWSTVRSTARTGYLVLINR